MEIAQIPALFHGEFLLPAAAIAERLHHIKAFIFDWDGVFNGGEKDANGSSLFNEVDSMGTNLLRFNHYQRNKEQAIVAIISGENNQAAIRLAQREHFQAVYGGIKHKAIALEHLCNTYGLVDHEVAFFFDDVLDFSIASRCGLRVMVNRSCNPLLIQWAKEKKYVDYLTAADGRNYAVRESVDLLCGLSGIYEHTIGERAQFSENYQAYLSQRNAAIPQLFTLQDQQIVSL